MKEIQHINIGIIGAGMMAENHDENIINTGKADVTWVSDLDP